MKLLLAVAAIAALGASTAGATRTAGEPCAGGNLSGTFRVVPGSAGAGNIVYALRLKNISTSTCFVTGIPRMQLLDKNGKNLPTHVSPSFPGALTAIKVTLKPGKTAKATARFSPDVPGTGEQNVGACERTAYRLRVAASGGGSLTPFLDAPISPPTAVCSHGAMKLTAFSFA